MKQKLQVMTTPIPIPIGPYSRVITSLGEIVDDGKSSSACMFSNPDKRSWYIIEHHYWIEKAILFDEKKDKLY